MKMGLLIGCLLIGGLMPARVAAEELPLVLGLEDCFRIALRQNPALQAELANVERAVGDRIRLRGTAFPTLEIDLSGGYQGAQSSTQGEQFALLLGTFSQPLFDLAIPASWRLGDLQVAVAVQNYWATFNTTMFTLRSRYIMAVFDQENEALLRRQAAVFERVAVDLRASALTGMATTTETNRAELLSGLLRNDLPNQITARRLNLTLLLNVMGVSLPGEAPWIEEVQLATSVDVLGEAPAYRDLLPVALAERPDLKLLDHLQAASGEVARIAFAAQLPVVDFVVNLQSLPEQVSSDNTALQIASGQTTVPTASEELNNEIQTEVRFGPSVTWSVFDGLSALGNTRAANARQRGQQITHKAASNQLALELREVLNQIALSNKIIQRVESSLPLAKETSRASLAFLRANTTPNTVAGFGFTQDEDRVLQLEQTLLTARRARALAWARLDFVTGRYLGLSGLNPPTRRRE